jgi:hypothetical protein
MKSKLWGLPLAAFLALAACSKDQQKQLDENKVNVSLNTVVDGKPLVMSSGKYINANLDTFTVSMYKYYISNIELTGTNGAKYVEEYSYHLIDAANDATLRFTMGKVPVGNYTHMKVVLGVDSLHNVSGAQTGDLDPALGMFWSWNTGYIMAKIEGNSSQTNNSTNFISMHLGGFKGEFSAIRTVEFDLPQPLIVEQGKLSTIHMQSDVMKWFNGSKNLSLAEYAVIGAATEKSRDVVENYKNHLSITKIEN